MTAQYPPTPELDKMGAITEVSQKIGEFLDWLDGSDIRLCRIDDKTGDYYQIYDSKQSLLAEFFEIDLNKVEEERRAILEHLRQRQ